MPRKRHKLPPKPSLERIQAMLARRRWDYTPPEPPPKPIEPPPTPIPLPESAGDVHRRAIGLPPSGSSGRPDETISSSGILSPDTVIPGTALPGGRPDAYLDDMRRQIASIGFQDTGGFQNRPSERDRQAAANRERIHEIFKRTACAGEWLPSGMVLYDCREWTPEVWERIILPTLQGFSKG